MHVVPTNDGKRLRIGIDGSVVTGPVPMLLRLLSIDCPALRWSLHETSAAQQCAALCEDGIDIGIWRGDPINAEWLLQNRLQQQLYCREEIAIALPKGHRLARRNSIALSELGDESLLPAPASASAPAAGLATLMVMVGSGIGGALVPGSAAGIAFPNVTVRRLRGAPFTNVYLAYGIDSPASGMQSFLDVLNKERGSRPFCVSSHHPARSYSNA